MSIRILIASLMFGSFGSACADEVLDKAFAHGRVDHPYSYAFDWRLKRDGEPTAVLRHDPRIEAPWTLTVFDGRAPSAAEANAYAGDESPTLYPVVGYEAVRRLVTDAELVAVDGAMRRYRFRPNEAAAPSRQEAMLFSNLDGEIIVRTTGDAPWIETVRIFARESFRPAPPAKIQLYERRFDFVAWNPFTEGPALKRFAAHTKGRVFFDDFERNAVADVDLLGPVERLDAR